MLAADDVLDLESETSVFFSHQTVFANVVGATRN
jgi:hypothetical protein